MRYISLLLLFNISDSHYEALKQIAELSEDGEVSH